MGNWMIYYKLIDGVYEPELFGFNPVPNDNYDKVIQVPEEIAIQAPKFDFDGKTLTRKKDKYIMSLEELRENYRQEEIELYGGTPPHVSEQNIVNETEIKL